jgi:DNA mismatch repair protein MutS2
MERTRSALREQVVKKNETLVRVQEEAPAGKLRASDLHVGDKVRVISMGLTGVVTSLPDAGGKVGVRCGIMNSKAALSDLSLIEEDAFGNPVKKNTRSSMKKAFENAGGAGNQQRDLDFSRNQAISPELNLLGRTTDEALNELDKYLDDARMSHLTSVRIVHGKGTGALRKAVHNYLRKQKWVKSYRLGDFGEGDAGVTIVQFK